MFKLILSKLGKLIGLIMLVVILLIICIILPPTFNLLTNYIESTLSARGLKWIYDLIMSTLFIYMFPYKWYKNKKNY